jgi:hypothetical protein
MAKVRYIGLLIVMMGLYGMMLHAQTVPSKPLSVPVYQPMVLNPGIVGSKDFTSISFTSRALKSPDSQVLSYHQRLRKADDNFSKLGIGAYGFHEQLNSSWNAGLALGAAYHLPLDKQGLHNLGTGATVRSFVAVPKNDVEGVPDSASNDFKPNLDLGVYYYGPNAFAGVSVLSLLKESNHPDTAFAYSQTSRDFIIYGGYKFIIRSDPGIVIEPSLLISLNNDNISEPFKQFTPYLKIYLQNFYVGTYLKDLDILALFFQYQFPRFYTGVFLEFPRIGYLNNENIIFELSFGMNLSRDKGSFSKHRHW